MPAWSLARRTFVLVDGENLDATLGGSVLLPAARSPRSGRGGSGSLTYAEELWDQPVTGLFFLNASTAHLPDSFVQALLAIGLPADPAARARPTEKVVDIGIQRTLDALAGHDADVLLCSHDADFLPHVERLLGGDRQVGADRLPRVHQRPASSRPASRGPRPRVRREGVQRDAAARADHLARRVRPGGVPALRNCHPGRHALRRPPRLGRRHPAGRAAEAVAEPRRTPLGQARGPQPDRLDQGPRRAGDDRAGREGRHAPPRLHDPRADQRQHRHLAGDGGQAQGLPAGLRDAGEHLGGAPPAAADVGRRDRLLARGRRLQRGGPGRQGDRRRAPRLGDALPVRQPRQRPRPLRGHRPRDPRRPARRSPTSSAASAPPAR